VDEAENVCTKTGLSTDFTKLIFLNKGMEGINKKELIPLMFVEPEVIY
jgi:hypothetical protein